MARRIGETSYKETAFGIIPRSKLIPLEIEGIRRAWDFVLLERQRDQIHITSELLRTMHEIGFKWIFPEFGGKFRRIDVQVSKHQPPKYPRVQELIIDYCADLTERVRHLPLVTDSVFVDSLVELLAWTHHRFLWIHPFQDYNGRISRLLTNIILLNLDFPPIELRVETPARRKIYVDALQTADAGDCSLLEKLFNEALSEAAKEV